jgi:mitochondrial chaperone BCS1
VLIYHYYTTTNHLEQLDTALCRPMDVWIEFKNASKLQAENLFRNFFPSADADPAITLDSETDLDLLEMPIPFSPATTQLSSLFDTPRPINFIVALWVSISVVLSNPNG